jgi:hypothetical protein
LLHRVPNEGTFQIKKHKILYTEYKIFIPLPNYIAHREVHDTEAGMSSLKPYYGCYFSLDPRPTGSHCVERIYTLAYI